MKPLFSLIENLAEATVDEIRSFIDGAREIALKVRANPSEFIGDGRTAATLMSEMEAGVEAIDAARAELARRETEEPSEEEEETVEEPEAEADIDADALAELAARAEGEPEPETPAVEPELEVEPEMLEAVGLDVGAIVTAAVTAAVSAVKATEAPAPVEPAEETDPETVVAAGEPIERARLARPSRSRASEPPVVEDGPSVALTAAAENLGFAIGEEIPENIDLAKMMIKRRRQFGKLAEGTHDKVIIASADWSDLYDEERTVHKDFEADMPKIEAVVADAAIRANFAARMKDPESLTASGGLCAPVTPYYALQMLSVADRPVRAALPSFNADRGGINAARPASLSAIDDAVGIITEAQDAAGGTSATKTCQRIDCPSFVEVDVDTVYHCVEFGNLGSRTYPELVAQWNSLVLAAHARLAEKNLLDGIGTASTHVTAANHGMGASAALLGQVLAAANGMRSRHRMRQDAVLRVMLPSWIGDLIVSDISRGQFDRFDMTPARFIGLLRQGNVEPTFYIDEETGSGQIFGSQGAAALKGFPSTVVWYLYPEGSFLYLDGGTLELGLVRDSVLNSTNDFQIFGETFENVAFIGVESLKVTSTVCDSGVVAAPADPTGCGTYS